MKDKPLHGKFVSWYCSGPIDLSKSFYWLKKFFTVNLKVQFLLFRIRLCEQETKIMHVTGSTVMCRLCRGHEETIHSTIIYYIWKDLQK